METKLQSIKYRRLVIVLCFLLTVGALLPLLRTQINPDLETYLPESMSSIVNNNKLREVFGKIEPLMIIFEADDVLNESTLRRVQSISKELDRHDEFSQVLSLFQTKNIHGEGGIMLVDPAIRRIPKTEATRDKLRVELLDNELANGLVVSADFHYTLIILNTIVENHDSEVMALVDSLLQAFPGNEQVCIGGELFLRAEANDKIGRDLMILLPFALIVMLCFLWLSFREFKGMMMPFMVVLISTICSMGIIPLMGWELSIIGVLVPIMMIAIANNYGVHFIARYQELRVTKPHMGMADLLTSATRYLRKPIVLTGLTTMVGIMGLMAHILVPAKQIGIVVAFGVGLALILSLTFIPAFMSYLRKGDVVVKSRHYSGSLLLNWLKYTSLMVVGNPRLVVVLFGLFTLLVGNGLVRLEVASDFNSLMPKNHPLNNSVRIADQHFGGSKMIQVVFSGDLKDPGILSRIDDYTEELEAHPNIDRVSSLAGVIRKMSKTMYSEDESEYDAIPDSREAVAQLLELYNMSGDPQDFEQIVDFPYENGLMTVQFHANSFKAVQDVEETINDLVKSDPALNVIAGFGLIEKELSETVVRGQISSLICAFVAIFILLILIFRNLMAGVIGSIPLLFALINTFGLMGWLGIELNIVTALLSSISIGLGVDFTIHLFWRLQYEIRLGKGYQDAVQMALVTIGRGISINALAVMLGFAVLFFSAFPLVRSFGLLIIASLFLCLISALMLIPAIVFVVRPKFLKPRLKG